jgi:hypothetical protein
MARFTGKDAKQLKAEIDQYPMPTEWDIKKAEVAALTSKSLEEFAYILDVDLITVKVWARKSRKFYDAINSWETLATFEIKKAMAKRAIGFSKTTKRDVITKAGTVETLHVETYYPPSETAGQFWLKNKAAEEFQDKREIDVNVNANIRAWLVSAGGQLDPSETIDISPGSLIANEAAALTMNEVGTLTNDEINSITEAELVDNTQANLEASLITDLIAEAEASPVEAAPLPSLVESAPDPFAALNSGWSK